MDVWGDAPASRLDAAVINFQGHKTGWDGKMRKSGGEPTALPKNSQFYLVSIVAN